MRYQVLPARQLDASHLACWERLRTANAVYDSPFFCREFMLAVAAVRDDVHVALMEQGDEVVGIFPFQKSRWSAARPVGAGFSEFHGPLFMPGLSWRVEEWLRGCGLGAWSYDHLPTAIRQFEPYHHRVGAAPFVDLSAGFQAYWQGKRGTRSRLSQRLEQQERKLSRELGEVEFELHDASDPAFNCLINWKTAQHIRTGVQDVFQWAWVIELLKQIRGTQTPRFSGMLSVLRAGGTPLAVHLGMRTATVAHMWYPTYSVPYAKYSPGTLLFVKLAERLADLGIQRVDFGPGAQPYKQRLMTGALPVAIGVAETSRARQVMRRSLAAARDWTRSSPLAAPARVPRRMLAQVGRWLGSRRGASV